MEFSMTKGLPGQVTSTFSGQYTSLLMNSHSPLVDIFLHRKSSVELIGPKE